VSNYSYIVSNEFAEAYLFCHMAGFDGYVYYLAEKEKYPNGLLDFY